MGGGYGFFLVKEIGSRLARATHPFTDMGVMMELHCHLSVGGNLWMGNHPTLSFVPGNANPY